VKGFGYKIENEPNTKQCSECEGVYPENQIKELCEHLRLCNSCYIEFFGNLGYEFVTDSDEFFHGIYRELIIENVYVEVKGTHKDIERVLGILSSKKQFEENPEKCFVKLEYKYYAANIFKERHDPIPWTSEYMTYREPAHRILRITLDGPLDQVKSINNAIVSNLGEPYKVKGPSIIQKIRGYRPLVKMKKLDYLMNVGKTVGLYLIDVGKTFSGLFPGIGGAMIYREIRKSGVSRKESLAISSMFEVLKIPLFIVPCEETVTLYTGIGVVESMGIALFSSGNQSKKYN
jgi:hypothetical protein